MRDEHGREIRADFIGMYAAGDENDCLAPRDELLRFAVCICSECSWVCKLALNLSEFIQTPQILRRADRSHHKRRAHRSLPQLLKLHTVARSRQSLEIFNDARPSSELTIIAGTKAKHIFRRRNARRSRVRLSRLCVALCACLRT